MRLAAVMLLLTGAAAALEGPSIMEMKEAVVTAAPAAAKPSKEEKKGEPQEVKTLLLELKAQVARIWALLKKDNRLWEQGQLQAKLGDYDSAYNILQKIIRTRYAGGPSRQRGRRNIIDNGDAHAFLAGLLATVGRQEQAVQAAEEAWNRAQKPGVSLVAQNNIRRSKEYVEKYPELGAAYEEAKGRYEAAPNDPDALYALVEALKKLRWRDKEKLVALARLREQFPEHPHVRNGWAHWDFGHACRSLGLNGRAAEAFGHMVENCPNHAFVKRGNAEWEAGKSCQDAGEYEKALEHYKTVKEKYPNHGANKPRRNQFGLPLPPELPQRIQQCEQALRR